VQFYLAFPAIWILTRKLGRLRVFFSAFCLVAAWNICSARVNWNGLFDPAARGAFSAICWGVVLAVAENRVRSFVGKIPTIVVAALGLILFWHPTGFFSWRCALFDSLYMPPVIGLVILFSLERPHWIRACLCFKPIQAIGITSYGIYLWQELFTAPFQFYTESGRVIGYLLVALFVIVPLSWFIIEKPAIHLGRVFADRVRTRNVAAQIAGASAAPTN
jgi:peptidoglycan/LPS O-acetylase OafA/YrhL